MATAIELSFRFYLISNNLGRHMLDNDSLGPRLEHHRCENLCDSTEDLAKLQILVW